METNVPLTILIYVTILCVLSITAFMCVLTATLV